MRISRATTTEKSIGSVAAQAESPAYFVERTGDENPLVEAVVGAEPAPTFIDIDGDFDAFIGGSYTTSSVLASGEYDPITQKDERRGRIQFFRNLGSATEPDLVEQTGGDNPFDGIDLGCSPKPVFVDIDNAGDFDAFVGVDDGTVRYFRNDSTPGNLVFTEQTTPVDLDQDIGDDSARSFVDVDGDGDFDAFVGEGAGVINFFENYDYDNDHALGDPGFNEQAGPGYNPLSFVDVENNSTPAFVDIDGRGDPDLFVGTNDGSISFFENLDYDGDSALGNPSFAERIGSGNPFDGVDVGSLSTPAFVDIDGDGDFDAFVGTNSAPGQVDSGAEGNSGVNDLIAQGENGSVRFFENTDPPPPPPPVGGVTESFNVLDTLGSWVAAATAGLASTIGAGASLIGQGKNGS